MRGLHVEECAAVQRARPLDLLRPVLRILPVGRGHRNGERQVAQRLELRSVVVEADDLIRLAQLVRHLDGSVEELTLRFFTRQPENGLVLIVVPIAEEVPEAPFSDRSARGYVEVVLLRDRIAARQPQPLAGRRIDDRRRPESARIGAAGRPERVRNVVRERLFAHVVVIHLRVELVAARLDRQVQKRSQARLLAHVAGAADLHLLKAPEIEVAGVGVLPLGHVDAFEERLVLP